MPTASVTFEFATPPAAADVLGWLVAAFAPGLTRAPVAWLGSDANPTFLARVDPLTKVGEDPRLKVAFGPGGLLSPSASCLVELRFAPNVSAGVAAIQAWSPGADFHPIEPWDPLVDHDSALAQFQAAFAQHAGSSGTAHPTRRSPAQAAAAGLALMAGDAGANWRVQMLRLIPAGHRAATESGPPADTWVVRFSSPHDKEAMAVAHVDDATGVAVRG